MINVKCRILDDLKNILTPSLSSRASVEGSCIESKSRSEHGSMHGFPLRDLARANRAPKKYRRTFWEEERQAQRARRQAQRAVCHGALPATRRRGKLRLLRATSADSGVFFQITENRRQQPAEIFVNSVGSKQIVRTTQIITARPKATPFGKRTPFAAYLRLTQER